MSDVQELLKQREEILKDLEDINAKIESTYPTIKGTFYRHKKRNVYYYVYEVHSSVVKALIVYPSDMFIEHDNILPSEIADLEEISVEYFEKNLDSLVNKIKDKIYEREANDSFIGDGQKMV